MAKDEEKVVATEAEAEPKAEKPAAKKAAEKPAEDKKETKAEAAEATEIKAEVKAETKEEVAVEQVEKVAPEAPAASAATTAPRPERTERPERSYGGGGDRGGYGDRRGGPRQRRRKVCQFCVDRQDFIDYKDTGKLRKFISERAKIIPRRVTGTCARHQRELTTAIKKARQVALLPYVSD